MSAKTETWWRCDRCHVDVIKPDREQPISWGTVMIVSPPWAVPESSYVQQRAVLCSGCIDLFREWCCIE